ncbi:hypothetical protein PAXRUDRAFT_144909 [Paxillus rubicundulus Ve08.2h10]|uniref:37S ribosomal protein mrp10, mitochondrial n=1 Tax=Paxillus rubicundulus Ve08.2h10 TaxID=930991 RepID=A0A0D0DVI5_9AGAM|nr:hypothetical protein PAXRUDRAFT_144909 [Paxillus rubicundulus Ve08.2h10]
MVHIANVKVRPTKLTRPSPCKVELVSMLGCWAATGDVLSADASRCKEVADALFKCMRTTPVHPKPQRPAINYHLSKLQRKVK